jgi:hypothetical protein
VFFGLHRHEVLLKPQYARLQIGVISGEEPQILPRAVGALSDVPYSEPTWLTPGYHSPYYSDVRCIPVYDSKLITQHVYQGHRAFQVAIRKFFEVEAMPDAIAREEDGKRPSQSVFDAMARVGDYGPGRRRTHPIHRRTFWPCVWDPVLISKAVF